MSKPFERPEEPLIVTIIKQRLAKGEVIRFQSMWGPLTSVKSVDTHLIDDPVHDYHGTGWGINFKSGVGTTIIPPSADEWDLIKHTEDDGSFYWELKHEHRRRVRESVELPDVADMVQLLLKKGEAVYTPSSNEAITKVERHETGAVTFHFETDSGPGQPVWQGKVTFGASEVRDVLELEKRDDGWHLMRERNRTDESGDEPVIVGLMRQRLKKGEPVYLGLGSLKYFLRRIEYKPATEFGAEEHWHAIFSQKPGSLETKRRLNFNSDAFWHLKKEEDNGHIMWRAWQTEIA